MFTISAGPKGVFDALDDGIEELTLIHRVEQGEAVDQAAGAAEHHLLVEHLSLAFAGEHEPALAQTPISDLVVGIRVTRDVLLVACRGKPRVVDESADQKPGVSDLRHKDLPVACLRRALHSEGICRVVQVESVSFVTILPPVFRSSRKRFLEDATHDHQT